MDSVSGDLHTKYQKIAAEYSKIRAQASVLKKAVVEEQTRNVELRDLLKEREQSLRKVDQEMDSLTFRNQQLTKRVTVLQDELDTIQNKSKKGKSRHSDGQQYPELTNHVLDEELQKKIAENALLLSKLHDKDSSHEQEVSLLVERIQKLEHELYQHHEVNNDSEQKYKAAIDKLESSNVTLLHTVEKRDQAMEKVGQQLTCLQQEHSQLRDDLGSQLQKTTSIIRQHLPFVDTGKEELDELNVPYHDLKRQIYSLHIISQVGNHVHELAAALSDYHTYTEQRLHSLGYELSPINSKFSGHLKENARYLRGLEQGYSEFQAGLEAGEGLICLETLPSLQRLSSQLSSYTMYLNKLLSYHKLSLEEETSRCGADLQACNRDVTRHTVRVTTLFLKLDTYVVLLSLQSKRTCQHPPSSKRRFLLELTEVLKALHEAMKDLSKSYNAKSVLEQQMPKTPELLHTTNECLVTSLAAVVAAVNKLSGVLEDSRPELCRSAATNSGLVLRTHPVVASLKRRATHYLGCLDQEEAPSIPYEEALRERDEARSSAINCDTLNEQLGESRRRATKLEQEKEHWRLEYQLLELKHSKKMKDMEDQVQSLSGAVTPLGETLGEASPAAVDSEAGSRTITNLLGRLQAPLTLSAEVEARELEMKNHFMGRIDQLVAHTQRAETKASTLRAECQSLQKRLEQCVESKEQGETALAGTQDIVAKLHEELQTTTHNYETQLSIMSEHLANMNDKLTVQRDEIDQLKYQAKSSRKGKQK